MHIKVSKHLQLTAKLSQVVKSEMKTKLLETVNDLLQHYMPYAGAEINCTSETEIYKRANNLVTLIKNDIECLERMREHKNSKYVDDTDINMEKQKKQRLEEHFNALDRIVNTHLADRTPKENHLRADNLAAKVSSNIIQVLSFWAHLIFLYGGPQVGIEDIVIYF